MLYDQHVHSYLSYDCEELPENYLKYSKKVIYTDHFDLNNPMTNFNDDIPNYNKLLEIKDSLEISEEVDILLGIEVGYSLGDKNKIREYLYNKEYDSIILSCHHNNYYDYMDENIKKSSNDIICDYFNHLYQAVIDMSDFNILAHFDYGLRIHDITLENIKKYDVIINKILLVCIENNIALELNTKSMYKYNNLDLYDYVVDRYLSLGGHMFTLGSDAHRAKDIFYNFESAKMFIKNKGINQVVVFEKRLPIYIYI
ncbi:PHP domain-containing protein [Mammaliicoccus sciuri]|uniref:Histidinol-phosphatase n=1 Tax=Mammaliicoccus sciuri TaxID=1296 RepID=A0ABT7HY29_MAMSC|nr:PHP domain-containing protein [Mammaliicoccus sciuri]MDL0117065.1 PHP domain-containing protein [Mammaliicoccus sciuri]